MYISYILNIWHFAGIQ